MEIYILRDGKETGPFSEETTQSFLKDGSVMVNDLAWTVGLATWMPLIQVLYPSATEGTLSAEPDPPEEPATERQKAFLSYIGLAFPSDITKERAAVLEGEAMENQELGARVKQWDEDRLRLHPELFAEELLAKRENRPNVFFELCQKEGADRFVGVTKAHSQVLMSYLDVRFPNWDARGSAIATEYFFAAIAEKFPQVVRKAWRGKIKFPDGPKVAAELMQELGGVREGKRRLSLGLLMRGAVAGLAIVLVLYVGKELLRKKDVPPNAESHTTAIAPASVSTTLPQDAEPEPVAQPASSAPTTDPVAVATIPLPASLPEAPAPAAAPETPALPASSAALPTPPIESVDSLPVPNPPATDVTNSLVPAANAEQVPARTTVAITKSTDVALRFGKARLPVGTKVKIISQEGPLVRISHLGEEVLVPIENTDLSLSPKPGAQL